MGILDFFRSKKINALENKVENLEVELKATLDLSKSLLGFADGNTYYYNIGKENIFSQHYTIFRGINLLSTLGSSLPISIYKGDEIVPKDVKFDTFDIYKPKPYMSFNELNYIALIYFFYRGEYMVEIVEEPFLYLQPINPQRMTLNTDKTTWKYDDGIERRTILNENLIYVKLLNPDDELGRGLSPVDVLKSELANEKSAIRYNTNYFKNHGQIGGFFYDSEGKARVEDMQVIVKQFDSIHKGEEKAYKTLGLPGGIRYEDFKQTMQEMQFLESVKDTRDKFLAILGIHKSLFGVTDQVNRSVSEEATRMLWLHTLKPQMIRIQETYNSVLFNRYFPLYTFTYDFSQVEELKRSIDTIDKQARLLKFLGYTTNEINEFLKIGMQEIDDPVMNIRTLPTGVIPFSEFDQENSQETATAKIDDKNIDDILIDYFPPEDIKEIQSSTIYRENKYIKSIERLKSSSEKELAGKIGKFFSIELGDVIRIVLGNKKASDDKIDVNTTLAEIMNKINDNKSKLSSRVKPVLEKHSLEMDKFAISFIRSKESASIPEEIIESMSNEIKSISNYSYKMIRNQIKSGVEAGETIDQIADRIKDVYKFQSARARVIARTETLKLVERTTEKRYMESGVQKKQWLNTGGPESREEHNANAAQGPIPINEPFQNGQMNPGDGDASQVVNCRCTMIPIID